MQPVAIFRFSPSDGPAFFADWLRARHVAYELVALDAGAPVPDDPQAFSGIGMMGGPMSANDALPWIEPLCSLLRAAIEAKVPVVGHCLGGQLLARALGASVTRAAVPELGWGEVEVEEGAREWFGGRSRFTTFQWHYETFALPPGARRVLRNRYTVNQAYVVDDRHLGLQCHVEMTDELVETWCRVATAELPARSTGPMQSAADIRRDVSARVRSLQAVAATMYERWAQGLALDA